MGGQGDDPPNLRDIPDVYNLVWDQGYILSYHQVARDT